jgi:hypothetical protein
MALRSILEQASLMGSSTGFGVPSIVEDSGTCSSIFQMETAGIIRNKETECKFNSNH